ncbi:hypothetical protein EV426DRAFT_579011 [Tirmania nivea]|nr:hypothetical protein EV426DRAFT_579011 [Tirmania nivea]
MDRNMRLEISAPEDQLQQIDGQLKSFPGTPIHTQKTLTQHCFITLPNSTECPPLVTSAIERRTYTPLSSLLPPPPTTGVFPTPPTTISELTLPLLTALSRSLTYSRCFYLRTPDHCITITHVTPDLLYTWIQLHKYQLFSKEFHSLWEYSPSAQAFIIKCMPTPIHENLAYYASSAVHDGLRMYTGAGMLRTPVKVLLNTEIATTGRSGGWGRRIPDLCIKVRIHPQVPERYFTGVVWEVGFSQTLASLKRRARMWLGGCRDNDDVGGRLGLKVHLVILVHVFEAEGPEEYYNEDGEVVMTRGNAREMKWDWPKRWFEGRGVVEEVERRRETGKEEVRDELIREIEEMLVEEDCEGNGKLMPLLMEPLGATMIVYGRNEVAEVPGAAGGLPLQDEQIHINGEGNEGQDESEYNSETDNKLGASSQSAEEANTLPTPDAGHASTDTGANTDSNQDSDISADDKTTDDDTADAAAGIQQVYTRPLLRNNHPFHSHPTPPFELSVAELYAPLPRNSITIPEHILETMPPLMRPHAHQKIRFPLEELVDSILVDQREMRERRARDRAEGIVRKAWEEIEAEMERVRREQVRVREARERELRLVERKARKIQEEGEPEQVGLDRLGRKGIKRIRREGRDI